jgi:hypothetical protein
MMTAPNFPSAVKNRSMPTGEGSSSEANSFSSSSTLCTAIASTTYQVMPPDDDGMNADWALYCDAFAPVPA